MTVETERPATLPGQLDDNVMEGRTTTVETEWPATLSGQLGHNVLASPIEFQRPARLPDISKKTELDSLHVSKKTKTKRGSFLKSQIPVGLKMMTTHECLGSWLR